VTTKAEFTEFVETTLEGVIRLAEQHTGKTLQRNIGFRWLYHPETVTENIAATIVSRVYLDSDHIFPCVDIGVGDLSDDGMPIIVASVAGYSPRPFQKNWTGRDGPFVFIIGQPFLTKLAGGKVDPNPKAVFGFITPSLKDDEK
jgi:hypothetical protein